MGGSCGLSGGSFFGSGLRARRTTLFSGGARGPNVSTPSNSPTAQHEPKPLYGGGPTELSPSIQRRAMPTLDSGLRVILVPVRTEHYSQLFAYFLAGAEAGCEQGHEVHATTSSHRAPRRACDSGARPDGRSTVLPGRSSVPTASSLCRSGTPTPQPRPRSTPQAAGASGVSRRPRKWPGT